MSRKPFIHRKYNREGPLTQRWEWERRVWRFDLDAYEHINTQCVTFGICFNWNFRLSIEVDFLFWTAHLTYAGPR